MFSVVLFFFLIIIRYSYLNDYSDNLLPKGYMGRVVYVNLTDRSVSVERLNPRLARLFFGGRGLGVVFLFQHFLRLQAAGKYSNVFRELDALSADNAIIISTSPTTGTKMPTSGRMHRHLGMTVDKTELCDYTISGVCCQYAISCQGTLSCEASALPEGDDDESRA